MTTFTRYILFQVPGWIIYILLLVSAQRWFGLPGWIAIGVLLVLVGKDFLLYPLLRTAYESNVKTGAERLIGAQGQVRQPLDPYGYVHIQGELWRAKAEPRDCPLLPGSLVQVHAVRGLTLIVSPEETKRQVSPLRSKNENASSLHESA
jgi:membrane protein implicated in regulation of membrane protease activity